MYLYKLRERARRKRKGWSLLGRLSMVAIFVPSVASIALRNRIATTIPRSPFDDLMYDCILCRSFHLLV